MLQWGRDIIVADREKAAASYSENIVASMGPRHHRRGSVNAYDVIALEDLASMGPRHHRRGSVRYFGEAAVAYAASMGPRHHRRGSCTATKRRLVKRELQWGRDIIVADRLRLVSS